MITKRIIPCLDVKDGRVVKGVKFEGLSDVSSPVELGKYYSDCGADELVFYDIIKSLEESKKLKDKNLLISTHGAAMTAMLNRMRGSLSVEHFWKNEVPPNCSVTIAELEGSGFKIIQEGIIFYKEEVKHWKAV